MPIKKDNGFIPPSFDENQSKEDKLSLINFCITLINQEREKIKQILQNKEVPISKATRSSCIKKLARYDRYYSELEHWRSDLLNKD